MAHYQKTNNRESLLESISNEICLCQSDNHERFWALMYLWNLVHPKNKGEKVQLTLSQNSILFKE